MAPSLFRLSWLQGGLAVYAGLAFVATGSASETGDAPASTEPSRSLEVEIDDGLLTLAADGAPLAEVLKAIGDAGAFRVKLRGELATPVHDDFSDQPLERAIRRLVGDRTLVMIKEPAAQGAHALTRIVVGDRAHADGEPAEVPRDRVPVRPSSGSPKDPQTRDHVAGFTDHRPRTVDFPFLRSKEDIMRELLDVEPEVRMAAIPKVGSLREGEARNVLSHVFANETEAQVRSRGVAAATRLDPRSRAALLKGQAIHDEDPQLRMQALNALAASQDMRLTSTLGRVLRSDPDSQVRLTAVRALQRTGGVSARDYLERAALDIDPSIRDAATQALATLAAPSD